MFNILFGKITANLFIDLTFTGQSPHSYEIGLI